MAWTNNFRADLYQKHLKFEHSSAWATYQILSEDEKLAFFDIKKVPFNNTMLPHINTSLNIMPLIFLINLLIIDVLIGNMFFYPDDHGKTTQKTALKLFIRKENRYEVKISNSTQFHLIVAYIARGISFRQCEGLLNDTRKII